jgi:hypothetical protein
MYENLQKLAAGIRVTSDGKPMKTPPWVSPEFLYGPYGGISAAPVAGAAVRTALNTAKPTAIKGLNIGKHLATKGLNTGRVAITRTPGQLKSLLSKLNTGYRYLSDPRALRHTPLRHVISPKGIGQAAGLYSIGRGVHIGVKTPDLIVDNIVNNYDRDITPDEKQRLHEIISWKNAPTIINSALTEDTPISKATRELLSNTIQDELRWRAGMPDRLHDKVIRFMAATPAQAAFRLTPWLLSKAQPPDYNTQLKNIARNYALPVLTDPQLTQRPEYPLLRDLSLGLAKPTLRKSTKQLVGALK